MTNPTKHEEIPSAKDELFAALSTMCPGASHGQLLAVIKALEKYVNQRVMEHLSL